MSMPSLRLYIFVHTHWQPSPVEKVLVRRGPSCHVVTVSLQRVRVHLELGGGSGGSAAHGGGGQYTQSWPARAERRREAGERGGR